MYALRATPTTWPEACATPAASWAALVTSVRLHGPVYEGPYPTRAAAEAILADRLTWMTPGLYRYDVVRVADEPVGVVRGRLVRLGLGCLPWREWDFEAQSMEVAA